MTRTVAVLDYGIGNLRSVARAFERCGAQVKLVERPAALAHVDHVVLPGVGAFADGMEGLRLRGLDEALTDHAASGRPLLGICLGMQMLLTRSEEFGDHAGLSLIPGTVKAIPRFDTAGVAHKIPSIGWSDLEPAQDVVSWKGTPLASTTPGSAVYLLHSFEAVPDDRAHLLAAYSYGGHRVSAAVSRGFVFGVQFHPEKSGRVGLKIVEAFVDL